MPIPPDDPDGPTRRTLNDAPVMPPDTMRGEHFGRAGGKRHLAMTPQQHRTMGLIRKAAARLFAAYGVGAIGFPRIADAVRLSDTFIRRYYRGRGDLLADLLAEHLAGLNEAVCAACDGQQRVGPDRLEAVIGAWLDHVATEPNEHHTLLFCAHLLAAERREQVRLKVRILLETVYEALTGAVPGLADRADTTEPLLGTLRALLSDPASWPEPDAPEQRRRQARRIAGMLIAAASAELAGAWPTLGTTAGKPDRRHVVEAHRARARFKELLDAVTAGTEVTITRHGRPAVRLLRSG